MSQTISSKFGHGGPRANAGGPRENSGGPRPGAGRPAKAPEEPTPLIPTGPRWCVYHTHPQAERVAAEELTRTGYHGYAPLIAVWRQDPVVPSMVHKVRVARFPGYGFVEIGPTEPLTPILETKGVAGILRALDGCYPARIPDGEIERHMDDDNRLCDLRRLRAPPTLQAREALPPLLVGTRVILLDGALMSREATVTECDGLMTTVDVPMFGRVMPVRIERVSVQAV